MFGWFKSEKRERRRKIKLDRKHLEARSRRFLKSYLNADETRKPQFYRAVEEASKQCQPVKSGLPPPELEDAQIAEATSGAAMKMVLGREERGALKKDERISDFVTDAYASRTFNPVEKGNGNASRPTRAGGIDIVHGSSFQL